jgi:hypothetical protein
MPDLMGRRGQDEWIGSVFLSTGPIRAKQEAPGYYRMTGISDRGNFTADYLGTEMPKGEPVYIWDGTTCDLPAIPSTVVPWREFKIAAGLLAVMQIYLFFISSDVTFGFWAILSLPIIGWPFLLWFRDIEPVRGTKVIGVLIALNAIWAAKNYAERQSEGHQDL